MVGMKYDLIYCAVFVSIKLLVTAQFERRQSVDKSLVVAPAHSRLFIAGLSPHVLVRSNGLARCN